MLSIQILTVQLKKDACYNNNNNNNTTNNNKGHIYTGKFVQQNEFAAINQGPVSLIPRICNL